MNIPEREVEATFTFTFLLHVVQRHDSKYGLHLQIKPVEKRRRKRRRERGRGGGGGGRGEYMYIQ